MLINVDDVPFGFISYIYCIYNFMGLDYMHSDEWS